MVVIGIIVSCTGLAIFLAASCEPKRSTLDIDEEDDGIDFDLD